MPANSTTSAVARQWELLKQLPTRLPGVSCAELVLRLADSGYRVSKRTVERDLNDLSNHFPLQCNDKGTPYGWYWTPSTAAYMPGISTSDALTLSLAESSLRPLISPHMLQALEPRLLQARQKLDALVQESPGLRWANKLASVEPVMPLLAPTPTAGTLETLYAALLEERQLRGHYFWSHSDKTSEVILNPLALIQRGKVLILIATDRQYAEVRQFAAHRFSHLNMLESPAIGIDKFNLEHYLSEENLSAASHERIRLQAWVSHDLARILRDTPLASDMELHSADDGFLLSATVSDSPRLRTWLLSQAGALIVRGPTGLRDDIASRLEQAARQHQEEPIPCN